MTTITAVFEVLAGSAVDINLDITNLNPEQIAEQLDDAHPGISLCHECGRDVSDPQIGELVAFTVNGVHYSKGPHSQWVRSS